MTVRADRAADSGHGAGSDTAPRGRPVTFAISEVARQTGRTADTLRVWQRRYGLGASGSSRGGHRRYSPVDVARLRAAQQLMRQGVPTAEAARIVLTPAEHGLALPTPAHPRAHQLAAAALDLDGPCCRNLLREHLAAHSVDRTWQDVLQPVLAAVGARWSDLPHRIAVEHLLSHVAAAEIARAHPGDEPRTPSGARRSGTVLLACAPEEQHDLPLVALAAALGQRGVVTTLLGAATPDALAQAVRRTRPAVVAVLALLPELADPTVFDPLPTSGLLLAAGPGWTGAALPPGVRRVDDLLDALRVIGEAGGDR